MSSIAKRILKSFLPPSLLLRAQVRSAMRGSAEAEVKMLPVLARTGSFLDVGANRGAWTGPAARAFGQVHAFEPVAELAAALRTVAPANVVVHELALSDHAGRAAFGIPVHAGRLLTFRATLEAQANVGFQELKREVTLATLDSLELRAVDAIKVDVEGHEAAMLDGAWRTIERERPTLIVEIEERHHAGGSEAIIDRITARGYVCTFVRDGRLEQYRSGTISDLQPDALVPGPGYKADAYINNFIFSPLERAGEMAAMQRVLAR